MVRPFPGPGVRTQVSTDGGTEPVWSRDGHWLFYRQNQRVMAASIRTVPTFKVTSIEKRFQVSFFAGSYPGTHYDVSPDNMQLVFAPTAHAPRTIIVHNWRDELLARVAAGAVK